jgi:hypothetical protein
MSIVAPIPDNLSDAQTEGILYNWCCCPKGVPLGAITAMTFDPATPARAVVDRDGLQPGELSRRLVPPRRTENWSLTSLPAAAGEDGGWLAKHAQHHWLLLAESPDAAAVRGDDTPDCNPTGGDR